MLNRINRQKNRVFIGFLFLSILSSCHRSSKPLDRDQKEKITAFFEELLLEHGGAYTLFGSKPMTDEPLEDYSEEAFQKIQYYLTEHPEIEVIGVDRKLEEGWEEWKKNPQQRIEKNFILTEIDLKEYKTLVLLNVKTPFLSLVKIMLILKKL